MHNIKLLKNIKLEHNNIKLLNNSNLVHNNTRLLNNSKLLNKIIDNKVQEVLHHHQVTVQVVQVAQEVY